MNKSEVASSGAALALLLIALSGSLTAETPTSGSVIATETASRTIEDGGTGPHKALMASDRTLASHTVFRPQDLAGFGPKAKLPIIAWGNGACANSPWEHVNFLSEIASHGFLVVAIGPMPAEGQRGGRGGFVGNPLRHLFGDVARHGQVMVDDLPHVEIHQRQECGTGKEERPGAEQGEPDPNRRTPPAAWGDHGMR